VVPERAAFEAFQPFREAQGWGEFYELCGRMLDSYFMRWRNADRYWQIVGVESMIELPQSVQQQLGFPYTSRLDMFVIDHSAVIPVGRQIEHKSAWRLESNLLTGYGQDDQVVGQIFLNDYVNWAALGVAYGGGIVNITTKAKKDPVNERVPVFPGRDQLQSWIDHKRWWSRFVQRLEHDALIPYGWGDELPQIPEEELFPKNYTQCVRRFGRCAYFDYCRNFPSENLVQIRRRHAENDLPERFRKQGFVPEATE
jgi:hypothetical protein